MSKEQNKGRTCANCARRRYRSMFGWEYCIDYEKACDDAALVEAAKDCPAYTLEEEDEYEEEYTPSSTAGDYGPGNPWDAPGMSIRDFI